MSILVHYDVIPAKQRYTERHVWNNVPDWTALSAVDPGAVPWTCYCSHPIYSYDGMRLAHSVTLGLVATIRGSLDAQGNPTSGVRLVSYYNDASGQRVVDRTWGTPVIPAANLNLVRPYGIGGQAQLDKWNAIWRDTLLMAQAHYFYVEVKGSGDLYSAWLDVDFQRMADEPLSGP